MDPLLIECRLALDPTNTGPGRLQATLLTYGTAGPKSRRERFIPGALKWADRRYQHQRATRP